eukprot:RCo027373
MPRKLLFLSWIRGIDVSLPMWTREELKQIEVHFSRERLSLLAHVTLLLQLRVLLSSFARCCLCSPCCFLHLLHVNVHVNMHEVLLKGWKSAETDPHFSVPALPTFLCTATLSIAF